MDSDYETGLNGAVRDSDAPLGNGGYSYWAEDKGWQSSPGASSPGTSSQGTGASPGPRGARRGAGRSGAGAARAASGAGAGYGAGGYGPDGYGTNGHGTGGDPTAFYGGAGGDPAAGNGTGNGRGPGGPGGPGGGRGRGGGGGGRRRGPGGPGGPGRKGTVKGSWWRHWSWRKALALVGTAFALFFLLLVGAYYYLYNSTQIPTKELVADTYQNSTVYYSDGKTPIGTFAIVNRQILGWNQIPTVMDNAAMAAEDRSFMTEGGVSPTGILRAAWDDITGSGTSLSGGSTITQEFVRQYYEGIGTQQTLSRKIKEAFVAEKISKEESKPWILTNYLNTIFLGDNSYGVAAAAQTYFGLPVAQLNKLTVAQAAVIAAIIQEPTYYPELQYRPELKARWHYVLNGMVKMGKLTPAKAASEKFPKLLTDSGTKQYGTAVSSDPWAPYIMDVVANELEDVDHMTQEQLDTGGYKIVTTISRPMQVALYQAVDYNEKLMKEDGGALPWYALVGAELQNPSNGSIIAMYAGRGQNMPQKECDKYHCDENTAVYAREQVGSSFKPYVLATAVSENMNVKTSVLNGFSPLWVPPDTDGLLLSARSAAKAVPGSYPITNDGNESLGPLTVQNAFAQSSNTAFSDLAHRAGTQNIINMAGKMGVNLAPYAQGGSGLESYLGEVGLALGIAPLTVNEQDTMLSTIDDDGMYHSAHLIQSIINPGAKTSKPGFVTTAQVLSPALDSQVQYAMSTVTVDGTGTAAEMSDGRPIIGKTGTTNTAQSAFFIGAIPQYSLSVGIFTENQSTNTTETLNGLGGDVGGGFGGYWPARIWNTFAEAEFAKLPPQDFPAPDFTGLKWNQVGKLPKKKTKCATKPGAKAVGRHGPKPVACPSPSPSPTQPGHGRHGGLPTPSPSPTISRTFPGFPTGTPTPTPTGTGTTTPTATPTFTLPVGPPTAGAAAGANVRTAGSGPTAEAGLALGGVLSVLPGSLLWTRASRRRRRRRRGAAG